MVFLHCNPFRLTSAKFGTSTVVSVNRTLVEDKMHRFIYTHDGASAKFSTTSHETDTSVFFIAVVIFAAINIA